MNSGRAAHAAAMEQGKKTVVMNSDGSSNNTLEISLNRLSGAGCAA